jgi:hypothetical protein
MKYLIVLILLITSLKHINAQNNIPILDRKVTIKITNQPLGKVLNIISETADFNFSYGNNVVKVGKLVTIHAENRTVREVLDQLFGSEVSYQQIGNHLVLQKRPIQKNTSRIQQDNGKQTKYYYVVSGYLRDGTSGNGVTNVSVYEKSSLSNTLSGDFGYYKMSVTSRSPEISLHISSQTHRDTLIKVSYENNGLVAANLNLESRHAPVAEQIVSSDTQFVAMPDTPVIAAPDTADTKLVWQDSAPKQGPGKIRVEETQFGKWFINNYQRITEKNIRDSFDREWQLTFVPPIGSNGILSGLVTNKVSVNILVGYNGGLHGAEFGGLVNIIRRDMLGAQFAGLANIVGGNASGGQFAGLFNNNLGDFEGFQGAGLFNHNFGVSSGVQAAGLYNYNHSWSEGVHLAGLLNVNRGPVTGLQVSGVGNYAGGSSDLMQVSGVLNVANRIDGGQLGVINVARKIRGFQIGIINIADSSDGIAIGIVNFIKNGTHQLEISLNEARQYGLAYRSGTRNFYSNVMVTTQLPMLDMNTLMSYGFGLGTALRISNTFKFTLDIASHHQTFNFRSDHLNLLNRLNANLEVKLVKGMAIFGGASLNHMISDTRDTHYETTFRDFGNTPFWKNDGTYAQKAWIGYQFGLRLF